MTGDEGMAKVVIRKGGRRRDGKPVKTMDQHLRAKWDYRPPDWRERVIRALYTNPNLRSAGEVAGVSYQTLMTHRRNDPSFAMEIELARQACMDSLEGKGYDIAMGGDGQMLRWFLTHNRPEVYSPKSEVTHKHESHVGIAVLLDAFEAEGYDRGALLSALRKSMVGGDDSPEPDALGPGDTIIDQPVGSTESANSSTAETMSVADLE